MSLNIIYDFLFIFLILYMLPSLLVKKINKYNAYCDQQNSFRRICYKIALLL